MAHLPTFESLFPLSDDVAGLISGREMPSCGCLVVHVPHGFLSAKPCDFDPERMPELPTEGTH